MAEEEKPQIGMADLEACVQIIDACSQRGAFKGDELEPVGSVRNRINSFVAANKATMAEEASAPESPSTADGTQAELPLPLPENNEEVSSK
tara:strand:- start:2828 stop:3100 length:273 start_codon:yes stop_codon:yes gene_type:complete